MSIALFLALVIEDTHAQTVIIFFVIIDGEHVFHHGENDLSNVVDHVRVGHARLGGSWSRVGAAITAPPWSRGRFFRLGRGGGLIVA